ncbi:MAG TPA: hypothetical protein VF533_21545 [Solirubrobacteraceae bacterium]
MREALLDYDRVQGLRAADAALQLLRELDHADAVLALQADRFGVEAPLVVGNFGDRLDRPLEALDRVHDVEHGVLVLEDLDMRDAEVRGHADEGAGGADAADVHGVRQRLVAAGGGVVRGDTPPTRPVAALRPFRRPSGSSGR